MKTKEKTGMKRAVTWSLALVFVLSMVGMGLAADQKIVKIPTCWMDESPAFNPWYAKKMGWDKEEGLDIEMILFSSGPAQMEALPAKQWVLGATSVGGQLIGGMRYKISVVAPLLSEEEVSCLYVRPDSPILKDKGFNPQFKDVFGSPTTVKGVNVLLTSQTTVHYVTGRWLGAFGLKDSDATLTNMEQASIIPAFEKGIGDVAALWAPFTFAAESRGWKKVASSGTAKAFTASMIVGDRDWCEQNPELVAKFLRVIYRVNNFIEQEKASPKLIKVYQEFLLDFCGTKMSEKDAKNDLVVHPRWSLQEGIKLSDGSKGPSQEAIWLIEAADFFASVGRFSKEEVDYFKKQNLVTDKFLKLAAEKPLLPVK